MTKEDVQMLAFQMISLAGNAMDCFYNSLLEKRQGNQQQSDELFEEGEKNLNECHQIQTNLIQEETRGGELPYSLIMTHAQDHFTNALNWKMMVKLLMNDKT